MSNEQNVPEIRFEGISGKWVEKQLNHEVELFSGLTYSPKDIRKEGVFVVRSSNVKNGQIVQADNVYVDPKVVNCSNVQKGDIIVVVRNGSRSLIGKHAQVNSRMDNTVIGAFMTGVRAAYPEFINALFDTNKFIAQVERNLGATINQITNGAFNSMVFMFPEGQEKTTIGNYFQKLDTLINQHQQKHDKLSNLKKAMLEKMFPKAGETVPEIRFEGFSGDWEQVPFNEAFSFLSSNTLSRAELNYEQGKARNIHYGDILVKFGDVVDAQGAYIPFISSDELVTKMSATKLQDGDILFADAAEDETVGKCVEVTNVGEETVFSGLHTIATRPNQLFATNYLGYYLNSGSFHYQLLPLMQGTKVLSISKRAISTVGIKHPSERLEQERIGQYFHNLDVLINQHHQQITKLKNIKQACLDKMFV